jgi:large subunit ribosomal protein L11
MPEQTVEVLVQGGKATPGPPLGPALGPLGLNLLQVVGEINKETASFSGMDVPVKVIADTETKEFRIEVGTPPVTALVKKSLSLSKGSGAAGSEVAGDISLSDILKIVKVKGDSMLSYDVRGRVKEVVGTCLSMGVRVEGEDPRKVQAEIDQGKYDDKLL